MTKKLLTDYKVGDPIRWQKQNDIHPYEGIVIDDKQAKDKYLPAVRAEFTEDDRVESCLVIENEILEIPEVKTTNLELESVIEAREKELAVLKEALKIVKSFDKTPITNRMDVYPAVDEASVGKAAMNALYMELKGRQ